MAARKTVQRPSVNIAEAPQAPFARGVSGPRPSRVNSATQLAEALGRYSRPLEAALIANQERMETSGAEFAKRMESTKTLEEMQAMVRSGRIQQEESPYHQAALERLFGQRLAKSTADEVKDAIVSGEIDPEETDIAEMLSLAGQAALHGDNGRRPQVAAGFSETFPQQMDVIKEMTRQELNTRKAVARQEEVFAGAMAVAEDARNKGLPDEVVAEAMKAQLEASFTLFHMTGTQANNATLAVASALALDGEDALVKSLLLQERTNLQTGETIPSVGSVPSLQGKVAQTVENASKLAQERREENRWREVSDAEVSASEGALPNRNIDILKANGTIDAAKAKSLRTANNKAKLAAAAAANDISAAAWDEQKRMEWFERGAAALVRGEPLSLLKLKDPEYKKKNGTTGRIPASEMRTQSYQMATVAIDAQPNMTNEQKKLRKISLAASIGHVDKADDSIMQAGVTALGDFVADPANPPSESAIAGLELFDMYARAGQWGSLATMLNEREKGYYSFASALRRSGASTHVAMATAARQLDVILGASPLTADEKSQMFDQVSKVLGDDAVAPAFLVNRIGVLAKGYKAGGGLGGLSQTRAVDLALEQFQANNVAVKGNWIYTGGQHSLLNADDPDAALTRRAFEASILWASAEAVPPGEDVASFSDSVTLWAMDPRNPNTSFLLIDKATSLPMQHTAEGHPVVITMADVLERRNLLRDQILTDSAREANKSLSAYEDGINLDPTGKSLEEFINETY